MSDAMNIHTSGSMAPPPPLPISSLRNETSNSLATPSNASQSRSPFRSNGSHSFDRRRSSSRRTGTSTSSASRPLLTSRPVLLWTHEPPNFSAYELVLNPDLIAAFGGISDGSDLLEVRVPATSSSGNPVAGSFSGGGVGSGGGLPEHEEGAGGDYVHHSRKGSGTATNRMNGKTRGGWRDKGLARRGFLFKASQAVGDLDCIERSGSHLQLSMAKNIANIFHLHNRCEVILSKVPRADHVISHLELYFRDQYVGRADMWRLVSLLEDTCVYVGQRVTLAGSVRATVGRIFINEKKVMSGYVGPQTRTIFRSESAKYNLFLQMASEMWDFDEDGELYYEKALSGYLPDLIRRWKSGNTTHVISIILFARVYYHESELYMLQEADLPLRREDSGKCRWFIDYYKVMVDLESDCDWSAALTMLKEEFFRFRHDILLLRRPVSGPAGAPWLEDVHADLLRRDRALLAGTLSASHEGNILEAINLALNPFDEHYIDRDLNRTGLDLIVVSAGTGHFNVDKKLLRMTTERLIDNGIGLDLVCLTKMPLHSVPLFHFQSQVPTSPESVNQAYTGSWTSKRRARTSAGAGTPTMRSTAHGSVAMQTPLPDPLYYDAKHTAQPAGVASGPSPTTGIVRHPAGLADFYSIPHWVDCSFYNMQQDKPFRADRFVPRCKMHEVQMLGLMENEISDIALPYIDFARLSGVVVNGQSLGRSSSVSSHLVPFSSSGSGKMGRYHTIATESYGDLSGLSTREQRRLLREQFDRETFRDLESVPAAYRSLMVQGHAGEKSLSHIFSSSPPQARTFTSVGSVPSKGALGAGAARDSSPSHASSPSGPNAKPNTPNRPIRASRSAVLALPAALESHDEHADVKEDEDTPTKDSWDRQGEPASPRQKRISILPSFGGHAVAAITSHGGDGDGRQRSMSRVSSISSLNTIGRSGGVRPLSDIGKAKALVAPTEVTYNATPVQTNDSEIDEAKAIDALSSKLSKADSTSPPPLPVRAENVRRGKGGYSWLWSTLRGNKVTDETRSKLEDESDGDDVSKRPVPPPSSSSSSLHQQQLPASDVTSRQASLKIQALLKGSASRSSSRSRPPSVMSSGNEKKVKDDEDVDVSIDADRRRIPISIPQNALSGDSTISASGAAKGGNGAGHGAAAGRVAEGNEGILTVITDADGQQLLQEQEALEQALEEEEAKIRYAQQAQVEKQTLVNPCNPRKSIQATSNSQIMRWQHAFPRRLNQHVVKWRSMTTPACLPLTTYYLPSEVDLQSQWQEYPYQMSVSSDMTSFLVKRAVSTPPALAVLREMASQRLAQGYQFIVPIKSSGRASHTSASAMPDGLRLREPWELFQPGSLASGNPVFLSMTNQIHRIHYDRSSNCIHVKRYVRRIEYDTSPATYSCCIWARNLPGYQTVKAVFRYPDFGAYNWTHLDAVIAGHSDEESFTEATRYWRTRFVVVPSEGSPQTLRGPSGEVLSDEEVRLAGMDRLAELFNRARWRSKQTSTSSSSKRSGSAATMTSSTSSLRGSPISAPPPAPPPSAPLRFIVTSLDPAMSLKDEAFVQQVEATHDQESRETETRKQQRQRFSTRQDRMLRNTDKVALVKDMLGVDGHGLQIINRLWNKTLYKDTFSGAEFVTWLCQRFVDVRTRDEAVEWGQRFLHEGVLQHVHDYHGFLDGHYFYRIAPQHVVSSRATSHSSSHDRGWFASVSRTGGAHTEGTEGTDGSGSGSQTSGAATPNNITSIGAGSKRSDATSGAAASSTNYHDASQPANTSRPKGSRRLMMSRSMIIDVDPSRRSDRSEVAFLHYDLTHNPANGFNFQIHWLGSTARFIEDVVQVWTRAVERFGLRLIEAPINQIKDVPMHNPFQAPLPISLALHPPPVHAFGRWLPDHVAAAQLFEYALLRRFGFILDQEASEKYRNIHKEIVIEYRSRPNHFDYTQFVHRSGVAFVQVLPASGGFLWLDNRLYTSHVHASERQQQSQQGAGTAAGLPVNAPSSTKVPQGGGGGHHDSAATEHTFPSADRVRRDFIDFCSDANRLEVFYREILEQLQADGTATANEAFAAVAIGAEGNEPGKPAGGTQSMSSWPSPAATASVDAASSTKDSKRA